MPFTTNLDFKMNFSFMNIVLVDVFIASLGKIRGRPLSLATDPHLTPPAFLIYFSTKSQSWEITDK